MAASSGDNCASGSGGGDESACSTPFVSAPSSPARDPSFSAAGCFYSAPASPARGGPGTDHEYGCELGIDFNFDFSSRCPSPAAAAMSSADELFHNGQIRPMRLASFLLRPQALPPLNGDVPEGHPAPPPPQAEVKAAPADERGRFRSRSVHRRSRSLSPFRTHWLSPSSSPAPASSSEEPAAGEVAPSASRSSSSSSTASSASSSSSRSYRRWGFLKDLLHRSKSDSGKHPPLPSNLSPPPPAHKRNPSPAASRGRGRARTSAHARLYEARHAEAEEMRRRTFLPYRQGLLGCLGLGSPGYGAMHGLAAAAAAGKSRP
ncbi:serine/arginine repetitive matrix protein 1-like [Panicum virgatum]|uniref:Calmodulin-binding protein n=1 Tax=Panicum virgatum TaxID=38727 RepID=A0A8T0ULN9_PANVG|nr:serine/arginine repetitive matrix protein 1-like [Panicum virgatum]KAG2621419.1 hypothetical protein PVAP13_3NG237801 [Panicum virgatum]